MKKVAMIGVGKLGQDCAEVMADAGYHVLGYDVLPRTPSNFEMRPSIEEAVKDRDLIFIAAPTPHDPIYGGETPSSHLPNKDFDYTIVTAILKEVNKHVNKHQLVVLISTVLPGTVRGQLEPCITNARFIYNPYLIAMGTIKWDMVNPEMVIIGTDDGSITGDAQELIDFYKVFMENDPRYEVGTWDEAEAIKIFYNTFISTKIALVNMVQDVAEVNGNMKVDVVTQALAKSTQRIMGPAYMKAGLGDAGACHPRDNIALRYLADRLDLGYDLFDAIMRAREVQAERMALRCLKNGKNITIIGKAYKPGVPYTNGSASMLIGHYVEQHGGNLNYYDPNTGDLDLKEKWTDVYLIGYWEKFVEELRFPNHAVVIDPWRTITELQTGGEIIHYGDTRLGKNTYEVADPSTIECHRKETFDLWPELKKYENNIHLIYAGIHADTSFIKRSTELIVAEIEQAISEGKTKFIFHGMGEGFLGQVVLKIHRIARIFEHRLHSSQFIYINGAIDTKEVYEKFANEYGITNRIIVFSAWMFEYKYRETADMFQYTGDYVIYGRRKKFLCFNKVARPHRIDLLEKMFEFGLVDDAFYSFEGDENWINNIDNFTDIYPFINQNKDKFPLRLNINAMRNNPVNIISEDVEYFRNSFFSVVTETYFYSKNTKRRFHQSEAEDCIFPSEKIFKPIILQQPFIVLSRPGYLAKLRERGYKTFSPYIDEAYDSIEDDDERLAAIVNEIKRLCSADAYQLDQWTEYVKPIVDWNKQHFYEDKPYTATENVEQYFIGDPPPPTPGPRLQPSNNGTTKLIRVNDIPPSTIIDTGENQVSIVTIMPPTTSGEEIHTERLNSGLLLTYPIHLDGGGLDMVDSLIYEIKRTGRPRYEKAFEWCAGFGVLGFELLGSRICDNLVFSDYYPLAIETCLQNAKDNGLENYVSGYITPVIRNLPESEMFDLIISNPPHCMDKDQCIQVLSQGDKYNSPNELNNTLRLLVDDGLNTHREFFNNIKSHLLPNADIYLIEEIGAQSEILEIAEMNGFLLVGEYRMSIPTMRGGVILHFKEILNFNKEEYLKNKPPKIEVPVKRSVTKSNNQFNGERQNIPVLKEDVPPLQQIFYSDMDFNFVMPFIEQETDCKGIVSSRLTNNMVVNYPRYLEAGADLMKNEINTIIQRTGKNNYDKALNWCCGSGVLGFNLLDGNMCNELVMTDCFNEAIQQVTQNAENNSVTDKIKCYVTPIINNIPESEIFDLVVAAPPASADYDGYVNFMINTGIGSMPTLINYIRINVDQDFLTHKEFFSNIARRLRNGADIYLIENSDHAEFSKWGEATGITHLSSYQLTTLPHLVCVHYKYICQD